MNEREFDDLILVVKERDLPPCPDAVEANILRRIRSNRAEGSLSSWVHFLTRPTAVAMAALALVIITSSVATLVSSSDYAENLRRREETNRVLDLRFVKATTLITFERD